MEGIQLDEDQKAVQQMLDALHANFAIMQQIKELQSIPLLKEIEFWVEGAPLLLKYAETLPSGEKEQKH